MATKFVTFPWGIELEHFYPDAGKSIQIRKRLQYVDKKVLIMNRAFMPVYGIKYFIHALPEIVRREPTDSSASELARGR